MSIIQFWKLLSLYHLIIDHNSLKTFEIALINNVFFEHGRGKGDSFQTYIYKLARKCKKTRGWTDGEFKNLLDMKLPYNFKKKKIIQKSFNFL